MWGPRVQEDFQKGLLPYPRCTSVELVCSIRGERGRAMPPCPPWRSTFPVNQASEKISGSKVKFNSKDFFFFFCIKMRPNFVEKQS